MIIIDPNPELGLFLLRLAIAIVFLAHGPQKLTKTNDVAKGMGMKPGQVMAVGLLETLGAASMILGVYTQIGAIMLAIVMLGAIYMKTQKWGKSFTGENGWELDFMVLVAIIAVFFNTPAAYTLF